MHTEYIASQNAPHRCQGPVTSSLRHAEWFHDSGDHARGSMVDRTDSALH